MSNTKEDIAELFSQLEMGMAWYQDHSTAAKLPKLLQWQDEMSIRSYYIAEVMADAKIDFNGKYFIRRITVAKKELTLMKGDTKIGRAQTEALVHAEKEFKAEQDAEAFAVKCDILLKQINRVLQSSQQRISFEKEEWNRTKYTQQQT